MWVTEYGICITWKRGLGWGLVSALWVGVLWKVGEMSENFTLFREWSPCKYIVISVVIMTYVSVELCCIKLDMHFGCASVMLHWFLTQIVQFLVLLIYFLVFFQCHIELTVHLQSRMAIMHHRWLGHATSMSRPFNTSATCSCPSWLLHWHTVLL